MLSFYKYEAKCPHCGHIYQYGEHPETYERETVLTCDVMTGGCAKRFVFVRHMSCRPIVNTYKIAGLDSGG